MVKTELLYYDEPKAEKKGCPYCESMALEWAEIINGTLWKQCSNCGMIFVGNPDEEEVENEIPVSV